MGMVAVAISSLLLLVIISWMVLFFRTLTFFEDPENFFPPCLETGSGEPLPPLSVVIPAYNEEGNLERCLSSLLEQDYPSLQVLVVDDGSTDKTPEIAARMAPSFMEFSIVGGDGEGKVPSLLKGYRAARGEILLFMDADVFLEERDSLKRCVAFLKREGLSLLSLFGRWEMGTFLSGAIQFFVGGVVRGFVNLKRVNDPADSWAFANGQFIMTTRRGYEEAGTHSAVDDPILEDAGLAKRFKERGLRVKMLHSEGVFSVNRYPDLRSLVEGYRKNLFAGLNASTLSLTISILLLFLSTLFPLTVFIAGLLHIFSSPTVRILSLVALLSPIPQGLLSARKSGHSPLYPIFYPLGSGVMISLLLLSRQDYRKGRVSWKGRVLPVRGSEE